MSDPILEEPWFLKMNTMLTEVIINSHLAESHQDELTSFERKMKVFFTDMNEYQLNTHQPELQKQQAVSFSQQYLPLLSGLSQLYLACLDPEAARGRFDYGKERLKRSKQQQDVIQLVHFLQKKYTDLVQKHPHLPIHNLDNMALHALVNEAV
ncbi:hypothetical protein [Shewanella surugensis]|uniref:Uncharacterized protein n=1 Tax=Shewanella surugensis TaxID=212020 RepID=A0ABT0LB86_9GAMM|nr:hypothetical protein [Shewanella surugensis]MCL1124968.1 hypothetical protein [Shewanella surugensis]